MSYNFIIDGQLIYNNHKAELYRLDNPETKVLLTSPSNSCLLLIINNGHEITTREEIFHEVWEKFNIPINTNTFYQNISLIRRALRQLGIAKEVLITIPRKGISIANDITIATLLDDIKTQHMNECLSEVSTSLLEGETTILEEKTTSVSSVLSYKNLAITGVFLSVCIILYLLISKNEYLFEAFTDYKKLGRISGCLLYIKKNSSHTSRTELEDDLRKAYLTCRGNEYVYYNSIETLARKSIIICNEQNKGENFCRSIYIINKEINP